MNTESKLVTETVTKSRRAARADQVSELRRLIEAKNAALLEHDYFVRCRTQEISRQQLIGIVKQLYCFSVFFERLLARRITEYSSDRDPRIIELARGHFREEIGHAQLFRDCLVANGVSTEEVDQLAPTTMTKALFGYLTVTVLHENEYVSNVAIMQVMESIGFHFFSATLKVMEAERMLAEAMEKHTDDDEDHSELGVELAAEFDDTTMKTCERVIDDLYRLMSFMLHEWLNRSREVVQAASPRRRRTIRPARAAAQSTS
jgi:pyrroloquinoline quinone (PQQ) biosynthesis protein C